MAYSRHSLMQQIVTYTNRRLFSSMKESGGNKKLSIGLCQLLVGGRKEENIEKAATMISSLKSTNLVVSFYF